MITLQSIVETQSHANNTRRHSIEDCLHVDSKRIQTCITCDIIDYIVWSLKCRVRKKKQRKMNANKKRANSRFLVNFSKVSSFNFEKTVRNSINLILNETWSRISSSRKRRMRNVEIESSQSFLSTRFSRLSLSRVSKTDRSRSYISFNMRSFLFRQQIKVAISISTSIVRNRASF
jgi:hypothetical protein